MTDDLTLPDPDDPSFVDQEALQEVIEKAIDVLRPIGLTVSREMIAAMVDPATGDMALQFVAQLRPQAARDIKQDREAKVEFNQMMAERHEEMIEDKKRKIVEMLQSANEDVILGLAESDSCSHERRHPSGFCLDCGEGLDE